MAMADDRSEYDLLKEYRENLIKRGIILSYDYEKKLIDLGFNFARDVFAEDLILLIQETVNCYPYWLEILIAKNGAAIFFTNGKEPISEKPRADANSLVEAAAKLIIDATERGFLALDGKDALAKGLVVSDYKTRSNLHPERNWIMNTLSCYEKKKPKKSLWNNLRNLFN